MRRDVVAEAFDFAARECLVEAFQFLQADDVRIGFLQPFDKIAKPRLDGIDVETCDLHDAPLSSFRLVVAVAVSLPRQEIISTHLYTDRIADKA